MFLKIKKTKNLISREATTVISDLHNLKLLEVGIGPVCPFDANCTVINRNLEKAEAQIGELSAGLEDVDKEVAQLRQKLNRSTKEAAEVEFHLNKAQETITAAESLVTKLEGEYKRWSQQVRFGQLLLTFHSEFNFLQRLVSKCMLTEDDCDTLTLC